MKGKSGSWKWLALLLALLFVVNTALVDLPSAAAENAQTAGVQVSEREEELAERADNESKSNSKAAIKIKKQPKNAEVKVNKKASFTVKASGSKLKYQWQYKNSKGKWVDEKGSAAKKATLKVKATVKLDSRVYRCKITDAKGNEVVSKSAKLLILPNITTQPKAQKLVEGNSFTLTVKATGTKKLTYQWFYQKPDTTKWIKVTSASGKKATLKLKASIDMDGWQYRCQVSCSNKKKVFSKAVEITVNKSQTPIELTAGSYEFVTNGYENELYLYGKVSSSIGTIQKVELLDEAGNVLGEMLDDGAYSSSGDDLPNDNIYSYKFSLDVSEDKTFAYTARVTADQTYTSEQIHVYVVSDITQGMMQETDQSIAATLSDSGYADMSEAERQTEAKKILDELVTKGEIKDTVQYNSNEGLYVFEYSNGVLGGIMTKDFSDETNGTDNEGRPQDFSMPATVAVPGKANGTKENNTGVGRAAIFFGFENTSYRLDYYNNTVIPDWEANGLATDFKQNVTVPTMKGLGSGNYNVIVIAMHGSYYDNSPVFCLPEIATSTKDSSYSTDLKAKRIAKVYVIVDEDSKETEPHYWLFPSFVSNYVKKDALSDTFVFSETCCCFGKGSASSDAMANAFLNKGTKAFVGFHNSVYADYSRKFMKLYVDRLIEGESAWDAFTACKNKYGATDGGSPAATPNFRGDKDAHLVEEGLKNGDFEEANTPVHWMITGDVRVIGKLGSLVPQHGNNMAILTTGIGSAEAIYLSGTEGSSLVQSFRMPTTKKSVSFKYDVVSEEPMEYVGSSYDDTVIIELLDAKGNVVKELAKETVNESTWYEIDGINFEGGDSTTYHTGWKTVTVDISAYCGKVVAFRVLTFDKGDSIYDTAVLVDQIVLK